MIQFDDLSDEIEVGDWLIPETEIARRRLLRETPRFKVYKADWFGDVLIYESKIATNKTTTTMEQDEPEDRQQELAERMTVSGQQQINQQLSQLSLNFNSCEELAYKTTMQLNYHQTQQYGPPSPGAMSTSSSIDSAYSSVSSTPRYLAKKSTEFEFPELSQLNSSEDNLFCNEEQANYSEDNSCHQIRLTNCDQFSRINRRHSKPRVVLNKNSFEFGGSSSSNDDLWLELNELRLIAHDNFILFMGVSMRQCSWEANEGVQHSLVMQMNRPKSKSLFNLLHGSKLTSSQNPLDAFHQFKSNRFFANKPEQQKPLTIEAKLNICQQVTNAMTYLHEKDIVHARLTSANIYIELNERVKISLIDDDERPVAVEAGPESSAHIDTGYCECNCESRFAFNKMTLTYLSPELVRTIKVADCKCDQGKNANKSTGVSLDTTKLTKMSDVFSFGTLLFELFEERFPFSTTTNNQERQEEQQVKYLTQHLLNPYQAYATQSLLLTSSPGGQLGSPILSEPSDRSRELKNWNGNITKTSASELIFQIGSGQIDASNPRTRSTSVKTNSTTLVDQIISSCWATNPNERPQFRQMKFSSKIY